MFWIKPHRIVQTIVALQAFIDPTTPVDAEPRWSIRVHMISLVDVHSNWLSSYNFMKHPCKCSGIEPSAVPESEGEEPVVLPRDADDGMSSDTAVGDIGGFDSEDDHPAEVNFLDSSGYVHLFWVT